MGDRGARIAEEELMRIVHTGDPVQLRDVAKALRVLASALDRECMAREEAWRILFRARTAIDEAQLVICPDYGKKGRRRRG